MLSTERNKVVKDVLSRLVDETKEFGIEILDVRIKRVDFVANIKSEGSGGVGKHYDRIVLRDLLVLRAPTAPGTKTGNIGNQANESVMLAVRDSQSLKLYFAVKNADPNYSPDGGWSLELRPVTNPADSQPDIQTWFTLITDGVSAAAKAHVAKEGQGGLG